MAEKYVYMFDELKASPENVILLGNKGAQLAEMTSIGLPVPPGFTITTVACNKFYESGKKWPSGLEAQIKENLAELEKKMAKKLGDPENPLLVSVRSGSYVSMPGMMDTVLNLGLTEKSVLGLAKKTKNERMAWDSYRRFIQMFGDVVMGVEHAKFEEVLDSVKKSRGAKIDTDLKVADLKELVKKYKAMVRKEVGKEFPQDPWEQLVMSIDAVFGSWNNKRAISYRRINKLRNDAGTGVNIQTMVFGNMGNDSATGVGFTRNPATGEKEHYGEYLINAQGEDVVAGIRTPKHIDDLKKDLPKPYQELIKIYGILEKHYKDLQDFEFTIEQGRLFLLQTRKGKRTAQSAVKIVVDMVQEKLINEKEAVLRIDPNQLDQLLHKQIDSVAKQKAEVIAKGLPASPGAAVGKVVFTADEAAKQTEAGGKVILVRTETSPEDIEGMNAAQGILTARGGMTCVAGDSLILTNRGFLTAEKAFEIIGDGEKLFILSYDSGSGKTKWKGVIATGRRISDVIEVSASQTGHSKRNTLKITPDHKMITVDMRELIKKPLKDILKDENFVTIVDKIPILEDSISSSKLAYIAGAIFTDGYIKLKRTKGVVVFTQKPIPEKMDFINTVDSYFNDVFEYEFSSRMKTNSSYLRGRLIQGEVMDLICSRMGPAITLTKISQNIGQWVLSLDEDSTFNFLAGVIDGDGSLHNNRIQIYASKPFVCQGVVLACLKLGIVPQVTVNRNIYNIQIVERIADILKYTKRTKGEIREKILGTKLFSMKQLFSDIVDDVNFMGRTRESIKRNIMFDSKKIARDNLPLCNLQDKKRLSKILTSDMRMYRVRKTDELGKTWVYNFEVDSENEIDKNFIVFTKMYTPLLISNSHAAVVARGMGKCCVAGCSDISVDEKTKQMKVKDLVLKEGEWITLDGGAGEVIKGQVPLVEPKLSGDFATLMKWADKFRKLGVRTNADTPKDSKLAREFGAEGIGLTRTEHMFFEGDRITAVREMILASNEAGRRKALDKLLPMQKEDFKGIFEAMTGLPVIIRLLDPPLHEFLPHEEKDMKIVADKMGVGVQVIKEKVDSLKEFNPMLGFRGCRLGVIYPEINEMQVRAIFEAALEVKAAGKDPKPEIEIPLIGNLKEFLPLKEMVRKVAKETGMEGKIEYKIGTMIEVPRAALTADEIAKEVDFMSFGTNDLTQMTCGFSRDDAGKFLNEYVEKAIYTRDPFQSIDQEGVGKLMELCVRNARKTNPKIDIGICGEHGGEPASVEFCHRIGLNNVSCSPYRVPIARLAAAQAALKDKKN